MIRNTLNKGKIFNNLSYNELHKHLIKEKCGKFTKNGSFAVKTGKYTGRSPNDRFIVSSLPSSKLIHWGDINKKIKPIYYENLLNKVNKHLENSKQIYVFDGYCGRSNRKHVRFVTEHAWQYNFVRNMFVRPNQDELTILKNKKPDFTIFNSSDLKLSNPESYSLNSEAFVVLNIEQKTGIIGGTSYAGEMKKGIFSLMNYWLPNNGILTMHCSANVSKINKKDTCLFFGLSGTGKTTLSADSNRLLIGDDEHGWNDRGVFNLEGGCYAKTINLDPKNEPEIYDAIKTNTILENVYVDSINKTPDYFNNSISENGRASYPIYHISNHYTGDIANHPKNILFLTCDAFGVLPPISKLGIEEAMYHFLSGYTAKVSGTERGITEPIAAFSSCYGEPFLPLHPFVYAELLKKKLLQHNTNVYLVNTGWYKGKYGVGERMSISLTRKCIDSVLNNQIDKSQFDTLPIFGLQMPKNIEGVDSTVLNPVNTWSDKKEYYKQSEKLAEMFIQNFSRFSDNSKMMQLQDYGPKLT